MAAGDAIQRWDTCLGSHCELPALIVLFVAAWAVAVILDAGFLEAGQNYSNSMVHLFPEKFQLCRI